MKQHFEQFASYNRWANARLYEAAFALPDDDYRRNVRAFFRSMHGTLNHLVLTDRIWMKRLTGEGDHPDRLDAILYEDRAELARARADEDDRIVRYIASLDDATIAGDAQICQHVWQAVRAVPRVDPCPSVQPPDPSSRTGPHHPVDLRTRAALARSAEHAAGLAGAGPAGAGCALASAPASPRPSTSPHRRRRSPTTSRGRCAARSRTDRA